MISVRNLPTLAFRRKLVCNSPIAHQNPEGAFRASGGRVQVTTSASQRSRRFWGFLGTLDARVELGSGRNMHICQDLLQDSDVFKESWPAAKTAIQRISVDGPIAECVQKSR